MRRCGPCARGELEWRAFFSVISVAPLTFAEALAAFEQHLYGRGRLQATVHTYASALRVFATFYREELQKPGPYGSRLQETDLHAFVDYLRRDRRLRAASMNRYVVAVPTKNSIRGSATEGSRVLTKTGALMPREIRNILTRYQHPR